MLKKSVFTAFMGLAISLAACGTPQAANNSATTSTNRSAATPLVESAPTPVDDSTTGIAQATNPQRYTNGEFGLSFILPVNWFGPEVYVVEQTLRLEVGSDQVYPYGTDPLDRVEAMANAYHVIIQYVKDDQNEYRKDVYQSLASLQDGESLSDGSGLMIRVRQLDVGQFQGVEYIATLAETAQTEPVYNRIHANRLTNRTNHRIIPKG